MKPKLFQNLPENLSDLNDEELAAARTEHEQAMAKIRANDTDFLGELTAAEVITQLTTGREQYDKLNAEQASRVEAQENFQAEIDRLTADVELTADSDEPEAATDEAEAVEVEEAETETDGEAEAVVELDAETAPVEEPEAVAAAADVKPDEPRRLARPPRVSPRHTPQPKRPGSALIASAGFQSVQAGAALDRETLVQTLKEATQRFDARPGAADVVVASARYDFPEERRLDPRDSTEATQAKLDSIIGEEALVASGGLCAPVTPYYELQNIAVTDRPVRDALAAFQAVRGGLRFAAPPTIGDITTGVGKITAAQDAAGGSSGTKTCQTVICPSFSEVDVAAIYHCLSAGNLGARAYPEQLAQFTDLLMAAHARAAETALLDGISAGSTQVTAAQVAGATASLFPAMINAAAQIRSHFRMGSDATLRVLIPAWAKDLLKADVVRQPFDKFQISDAEMVAIIRSFNLEPSFYLDGETGGGQVLNTQSAGALNGWPTTVKWFIFPEGTWLYLDGGTLELGLVRDSTLNATNTFQMFGETWENVAKVGAVSYEVTSTVQDTGALSAAATITNPAY
jgi:hypothetical protein